MEATSLVFISIIAFLFVFLILAVISLVMRLIIFIFPEKKILTDAATLAALATAVQSVFPGTKITKVEEKK